jgi:hypothetical protein
MQLTGPRSFLSFIEQTKGMESPKIASLAYDSYRVATCGGISDEPRRWRVFCFPTATRSSEAATWLKEKRDEECLARVGP